MLGYWLYLEPYTLVEVISNNALLFNTYTGKHLEVHNNTRLTDLLKSEYAYISENDLRSPEIFDFINKMKKYDLGGIIKSSLFEDIPIRLNSYHEIDNVTIGIYDSGYRLKELTLYINEECDRGCLHCKSVYKQLLYCTASENRRNKLELEEIKQFIKPAYPFRINITGGNIFNHFQLHDLIIFCNRIDSYITYLTNYENVNFLSESSLKIIEKKNSRFIICINIPLHEKVLFETIQRLDKSKLDYDLEFLVSNFAELEIIDEVTTRERLRNYSLRPFYDGNNLSFFKDFVFFTRKEILKIRGQIQDIKLKKRFNHELHGKMTILANGDIYSDINAPKLGSMYVNSLKDIIHKELHENKNWNRIRSQVSRCNICIYNSLCPPLTNYEKVIGRNNLCHFNPELS